MNRRSMLSFLGIGAVGASTLGAHAGNPVPSTEATTGYCSVVRRIVRKALEGKDD